MSDINITAINDNDKYLSLDLIAQFDNLYCGRMNAPLCSAWLKGVCGDEMEFYIDITQGKITGIQYYTTGCESTKACALTLIKSVIGRKVNDALFVSPEFIISRITDLPKANYHCAILTLSTFYKAIAQYMLAP